jgi:hypothetical protein
MRRENAFLQKAMWFVQTQWCPLGCPLGCRRPNQRSSTVTMFPEVHTLKVQLFPCVIQTATPKTSNVHMVNLHKWNEEKCKPGWRTSCKLKGLSVQEDNHVIWPLMIIINAPLLLWNQFPWTPGYPLPDSISQALKLNRWIAPRNDQCFVMTSLAKDVMTEAKCNADGLA